MVVFPYSSTARSPYIATKQCTDVKTTPGGDVSPEVVRVCTKG